MTQLNSVVAQLVYCVVAVSVILGAEVDATQVTAGRSAVEVTIHYSDGLPVGSPVDERPTLLLRSGRTTGYLTIRNNSINDLILWQPNSPLGDDAVSIEFKLTPTSKETSVAKIAQFYTGGMGIPKTFKLRSRDELIIGFDFLSYWKFPFNDDFERKTVYVRAVYSSNTIDKFYDSESVASFLKFVPEAKNVWKGTVRTNWQKVEIVNLTGNKNPLTGTCCTPDVQSMEPNAASVAKPAPPAKPAEAVKP